MYWGNGEGWKDGRKRGTVLTRLERNLLLRMSINPVSNSVENSSICLLGLDANSIILREWLSLSMWHLNPLASLHYHSCLIG